MRNGSCRVADNRANASTVFRLQPSMQAPALARAQLGSILTALPPTVRADALVMVSELVTNAVLHATGVVTVAAECDGHAVSVSVADGTAGKLRVQRHRADVEGGRGLALVAALSKKWGVRPLPDGAGKIVWF